MPQMKRNTTLEKLPSLLENKTHSVLGFPMQWTRLTFGGDEGCVNDFCSVSDLFCVSASKI